MEVPLVGSAAARLLPTLLGRPLDVLYSRWGGAGRGAGRTAARTRARARARARRAAAAAQQGGGHGSERGRAARAMGRLLLPCATRSHAELGATVSRGAAHFEEAHPDPRAPRPCARRPQARRPQRHLLPAGGVWRPAGAAVERACYLPYRLHALAAPAARARGPAHTARPRCAPQGWGDLHCVNLQVGGPCQGRAPRTRSRASRGRSQSGALAAQWELRPHARGACSRADTQATPPHLHPNPSPPPPPGGPGHHRDMAAAAAAGRGVEAAGARHVAGCAVPPL
jgi:hypothetical protein